MSASVHGPWRVTREICETGATWTDWAPTSFDPSRLSRAIILREYSPVVLHVQILEVLACKYRLHASC